MNVASFGRPSEEDDEILFTDLEPLPGVTESDGGPVAGSVSLVIAPVLDQRALDQLVAQVHAAVATAVRDGINDGMTGGE